MLSIVLRLTIIALLVYAGVTWWYGRVEDRLQGQKTPEKKEVVESPVENGEKAEPSAPDYQIILTRNIFQAGLEKGGHAGDSGQTNVDDLAETKLQLVLLGTVVGGKDDARAIIRDDRTKLEDIYRTGSEIQGAVIGRINRGKVVLQINGREEVLTIKDPDSGNLQGRASVPRPQPNVTTGGAPPMPERQVENVVPQAQPRRRISFRNTPQPLPGPGQNNGVPPPVPDAMPEEAIEAQPPAVEEMPPPELEGKADGVEVQQQGQ